MKTLTPAYGKDYKSKAEALADLALGKDFKVIDIVNPSGTYCSIRDLKPGEEVKIRYDKLRKVVLFAR